MSGDAVLFTGVLLGVLGLLLAVSAPRMAPATLLHALIGLSLALFLILALATEVSDQFLLVGCAFLIPGVWSAVSATTSKNDS